MFLLQPKNSNLRRILHRGLAPRANSWKQTSDKKNLRFFFANESNNVRSFSAEAGSMASDLQNLSARDQKYFEKGWMDGKGLTLFNTLHENQARACQIFAENDLYGVYNHDLNFFEYMSYAEFGEKVDRCRDVLKHLGIGEYDKVGIISDNRWEWVAIACAAYSLNAAIVPMYEAQRTTDWSHIARDAGIKTLFCATQEIYNKAQTDVLPQVGSSLQSILCLDAPQGEPHAFATLMAQAVEDREGSLIVEPTMEDLASLIYTSGTTGKPKGVELTHDNICANIISASRSMVANPRDFVTEVDRSLAFLPWAHSYGQTVELWMGMAHGMSSGICRGIPFLLEDLQMVRPSVLFAVPTLYKKVHGGVSTAIQEASPIKRWLMTKALELGRKKADHAFGRGPEMGFLERMQHDVLDKIVLSKIRDRFGGRLRLGCVAGAACPMEVINFMDDLGIMVLEGYGLTETSPIICINSPEQRSVGSVGRAIGGVTVHIIGEDGKPVPAGEEGEICCTGPNIMQGYHNNPEATREVISLAPDGESRMFHTGDLGRKGSDGYVKVTGRIKEQYKLENGKYVCPTPIEESIGLSRFISQVVLIGANRPYNVALLVPEWSTVRNEFNIADEVSDEQIANDPRVMELMDAEIQMSCYNLKKYEMPAKWAFVPPFTVENNMLTPKMSIRKHNVFSSHKYLIDQLYDGELASPASDGVQKQQQQQSQKAA